VARFKDVHASGYNSGRSERIWIIFGTLRVYCLDLAPTDFGRDPRRSESWRASGNFVLFVLGGVCATAVCVRRRPATGGRRGAPQKARAAYGKRARPARRQPAAEGAFSTLLRQSGLRASTDGVLATKSERKLLASTCLYSLYAWFVL